MTSQLPPAPADHYLQLPDAYVVSTKALLAARMNLTDTIAFRAMTCIYGHAGVGKTLAVNTCLRELEPDEEIRRIVFRSRPTARAVRHEIHTALELPGTPPAHPSEFDHLLKNALASRPRTLVVDEAQWLNSEAFEYFRYLWDDDATQLAIVFVGGPSCYTVLNKEPMLASRIFIWQKFERLAREEVLQVIPQFHPVWATARPDDILYADTHAAHGNFRKWVWLTTQVLLALKRLNQKDVDEQVLRWTFSRLGKA